MLWRAGWIWFKAKRSGDRKRADDPADMGVDIALDASLDSVLPPLLDFAVNRGQHSPSPAMPLGTDQRSHHHRGD